MNISYRDAKMILAKQEEAREVINSYRGIETLGKRLQLKNNKELILKLFEIEEDESETEQASGDEDENFFESTYKDIKKAQEQNKSKKTRILEKM